MGQGWCRFCFKAYYRANRERMLAQGKAWVERNPERRKLIRRSREMRKKATASDRRVSYYKILQRDGWTCHICGEAVASRVDLNFDHIIPIAKGGRHSESNIAVSHRWCNRAKGTRILGTGPRVVQLTLLG